MIAHVRFCDFVAKYLWCLFRMLLLPRGNNREVSLKAKYTQSKRSWANDGTANDAEDEIAQHNCRLVINCRPQHACRLNRRCHHKAQLRSKPRTQSTTRSQKHAYKLWDNITKNVWGNARPTHSCVLYSALRKCKLKAAANELHKSWLCTNRSNLPLQKNKKIYNHPCRLCVFGSIWCNVTDYKLQSSRLLWRLQPGTTVTDSHFIWPEHPLLHLA